MSHDGRPSAEALTDHLRHIAESALHLLDLAQHLRDDRTTALQSAVIASCLTIAVEVDELADALAIDAVVDDASDAVDDANGD